MFAQEINACGNYIDQKLQGLDARLTMGSEPTFTSKKYKGSPEWNISALGREKLAVAKTLHQKLQARLTEGAITLHAKGKWCEGEFVPRWSYNSYWLTNKTPLWRQSNLLIIDPLKAPPCSLEQMKLFIVTLTKTLQIPEKYLLSAYENNLLKIINHHGMQHIQRRDALINQLTKAKSTFAGFVLPLQWNPRNKQWHGLQWNTPNNQLLLQGFGMPIGFRLPNTPHQLQERALCVELRHQRLYVSLPKLESLDAYLHLLHCLETTAQQLNQMIALTGYEPPLHEHLVSFKITPDPGVLEINMPASASWPELVLQHQILHEEAQSLGLTTEKFLSNGRSVSTGGGHHIVIGSQSPSDSILLRKPALLRSLITYWQHHPSLAYLFADQFVGPTSQAPRMDEARSDYLQELEVELLELTNNPASTYQGLNYLFTDLMGNAHRAEICLDKLALKPCRFSLQGLVELRAFAMPPTLEMCLLQLLLVRALIAYLGENPYHTALIRWGERLHQQFFLPTYIWKDFSQIIRSLNQKGYLLHLSWFKTFYDHRFPLIGETQIGPMHLSLRIALEPWPVIGSEISSGTCSRIVDATLERVEIKVTHFDSNRYIMTCNNFTVPLQPTDTIGEYVAGIRFKRRDLPISMHPTVQRQNQLKFDVIDTSEKCIVGGFSYLLPPEDNFTIPQNREEASVCREKYFKIHSMEDKHDYIRPLDTNHQNLILDFCRYDTHTPKINE